jgi:hypothetical protein
MMRARSKIIIVGVAGLLLAGGILVFLNQSAADKHKSPRAVSTPKIAKTNVTMPATPFPVIIKPEAPVTLPAQPSPLKLAQSSGGGANLHEMTGGDSAALQSTAGAISNLLAAGDFDGVSQYLVPGARDAAKKTLETLATGFYAKERMQMLVTAFAALQQQTPLAPDAPGHAVFQETTIYAPVEYPRLTPEQAEQAKTIPVFFVQQNGQWLLSLDSLGLLTIATRNTPLPPGTPPETTPPP